MENLVLAYLFLLGACFGSFASVVVYRLKSGKIGILWGRSECGSCGKPLGWKELFPIFSWLFQKGRCAGCGKKIPAVYPILELVTGVLFAASAKYLCDLPSAIAGDWWEIARVAFFLALAFVTVVFVFYDILYQEIPDEILVPATVGVAALLVFLPEGNALFRHYEPILWGDTLFKQGMNAALGAFAIYTFFYLQFLIPVGTYCLRNKRFKDALEVAWYYVWLPFAVVWDTLLRILGKRSPNQEHDPEHELPSGWIGLGDLRIAVFMGLVAGAKMAGLALFLSYIVGSVVWIYVLAVKKQRNMAIAFGPFLAVWLYLSLFFYPQIMKSVMNLGIG